MSSIGRRGAALVQPVAAGVTSPCRSPFICYAKKQQQWPRRVGALQLVDGAGKRGRERKRRRERGGTIETKSKLSEQRPGGKSRCFPDNEKEGGA